MLFGQDRDQLRRMYCEAWSRHQQHLHMEPLQAEIAAVVAQHPEYHALLENPDQAVGKEYLPDLGETNPFLHMGMHLAIREQVSTNRPEGILTLYQQLALVCDDLHALDHQLMECLAEMIWQAQRDGSMPDEDRYLECMKKLAEKG
jgi:Domain of unknown function (DUF1841)